MASALAWSKAVVGGWIGDATTEYIHEMRDLDIVVLEPVPVPVQAGRFLVSRPDQQGADRLMHQGIE